MQPFSAVQRGKIRNTSFSTLVEYMRGCENEQRWESSPYKTFFQVCHLHFWNRLFEAAVKFQFSLPFINPARAPSSLVNFDHGKFIISNNHEYSSNNTVFLLPGYVMESHLVRGTPSVEANTYNNNLPGSLVKWIKVHLLSIEYERFCSFIGTHLPLQDDRAYVGPTSVLGVTFSTKKIDFTTDTGMYLMDRICNMRLWNNHHRFYSKHSFAIKQIFICYRGEIAGWQRRRNDEHGVSAVSHV